MDGEPVQLSPLDALLGHLALTFVYVFSPATTSVRFNLDRVHAAFVSLIEEDYPVFLGTLHTDAVTGAYCLLQSLKARTAGAAAIRFEKDPNGELMTEQAVGTPPMALVPTRDHASELITIKATLLCDGGLVLGINATHALLDGEGLFTFMNLWSMHYRELPKEDRPGVSHDRDVVMPRGVAFKMPHPEFIRRSANHAGLDEPLSAIPRSVETHEARLSLPETEQKPFHLTPQQLQSLKHTISQGLPDGQYVSTIDVVTALFTVLITQARGHGKGVKITTAVNGRTRFDPPLPLNYSGNCIFNALSEFTADELTSASVENVRRIAQRVRASVVHHDDAFMRDAIEFTAPHTGRWSELHANVDFIFGPDLMFTSWANLGMYDADFGAGKALYAGPPTLSHCDGTVIIMEATNHASGLDVLPLLECQVMATLTELWGTCALLHLSGR